MNAPEAVLCLTSQEVFPLFPVFPLLPRFCYASAC